MTARDRRNLVIGALCIGAAVLGGFIPSGWFLG